jgi:transposase
MWALKSVVIDRMSIARIAAGLGVSWHTVNDAVLATGHQLLIADPTRFDGVQVLGVDEHAWRHTRRGDKFVTVIIDLTPVRDGTGPSRLLDMVEGRSKQVFKTWLEAQTPAFRDGIEIVAMDGFTGFKTAAAEEIPDAVAVMDPFHVVALAGDALDRQHARLISVFAADEHAAVEATWGTYQRIVSAYRHPDRRAGKTELTAVIKTINHGVPPGLPELSRLGRTQKQRAADVLAYFDRPGTSNGPTEAINGRLEHLRGTALGFRNLTNSITRSLLDTGGFRPRLHPLLR